MTLLNLKNIGKSYVTYKSEWSRIGKWLGFPVKPNTEKWVLRNVNISVNPGDAIGIVGPNGAGKSTLLKLITGTIQSSEGTIDTHGRVAAILELGMGFYADLTGRQNVYQVAATMGFSIPEITKAIPSIQDFAEISEYFDEPLRTYSSGMQMRLAFSIATAWRSEILVIDEALSVGDTYFQHKSFARIREFREEGTTLLIVSHDRNAIQSICNRAILLENGTVQKDDVPEVVYDFYNQLNSEQGTNDIRIDELSGQKKQVTTVTDYLLVSDIDLLNSKNQLADSLYVGEEATIRIRLTLLKDTERLVLGFLIKDRLGQFIYGTNTWHSSNVVTEAKQGQKYEYLISFPANLGVGSYSVSLAFQDGETHLNKCFFFQDLSIIFNVHNQNVDHFVGCSWIPHQVDIKVD